MPTATNETLLIFRIAGIACAVPADSVGSIVMPPAHLTHPPGSARSTPGIFHHADATYSVVDLHARFGIDTPRKGSGRLLLQSEGIRHYAIWVDEVVGLVDSARGKWAPLPPYLQSSIFTGGFLYKNEIVLCSELSALRTMHDAAPLRLHLETLQRKESPREEKPATAANRDASSTQPTVSTKSAPPRHDQPVREENTSPTSPQPLSEAPTEKASDTPPRRPPPKPVSKTVATERRSPSPGQKRETDKAATAAQRPPATRHEHADRPTPVPRPTPTAKTTSSGNAPAATVRPPVTRPHEATAAAPEHHPSDTSGGSGFGWLLLLLIMLAALPLAYWLWPTQQVEVRPVAEPQPPTPEAITESRTMVTTAPTPEPAAPPTHEPEPPQTVEPSPPPATTVREPAPETDVGESALPMRIERDEEGTLNLIIDREAISAAAAPPEIPALPPSDATEPSAEQPTEGTTSEGDNTAVEPANEAAQASQATSSEEEPEPPLTPDSDWPQPIVPDPCDCTHIVVRGDTLWSIAERYTGSAFNYPELARRSGIDNPDLIYPGERIRITIR